MDLFSESSKAKACGNCKKAKAKCYGATGDGRTIPRCERCNRLNKECIMPLPHKKRLPRQSRAAQISQIEQKVNDLVTILTVNKNLSTDSETSSTLTPPEGDESQLPNRPEVIESVQNRPKYPVTETSNDEESFKTIEQDADFLLNKYRETLAGQFQFVNIPPSLTAEELCRSKPFLYKAILMAASFGNIPHQLQLSKDIVKEMTGSIFEEGKRNLDLLQGILVYSVWCQFNFMTSRGQMNMLLGILSSLIVDLRLVGTKPYTRQDLFAEEIYGEIEGHPQRTTTADEKKAVLGCFYVSSWVCASLTRLDPIRSTPFIRECCDELERDAKSESDIHVVHLIKLQLIVENITLLHGRDEFRTQHPLSAPIGITIKVYWEQLQAFKKALPINLSDDFMLTKNYTCAEILLFELGFDMGPNTSGLGASGNFISKRVDILHACLTSILSFFNAFLKASPTRLLRGSVINASHMVHNIAVLSKLSLFEAEDWDPKYARATIDLNLILDTLAERADSTAIAYDPNGIHPSLKRGSRVVRTMQAWYNNKITPPAPAINEYEMGNGDNFEVGSGQMLPSEQFDLLDAEFWNGIPGSWVTFN